jgi:hypothetical protein
MVSVLAIGFAGEVCRDYYLKLMERMSELPSSQHIMPSFFHLVVELERRKLGETIIATYFEISSKLSYYFVLQYLDYALVFRTFGSDSTEIAQEYNKFCTGTHPMYEAGAPMDALCVKCIDTEEAIGKITRGGIDDAEETYSLQLGSFVQKPCVINGSENIYRHILSLLFEENKRAMIIQDDYPYWHACGETDHSGKLLLIDEATENSSLVQIFFDDNVERDRAHIVDVRKLPGLEKVSFEDANDKLYVRVSPFEIISDPHYYINTFDEVLLRRNI